MLCFDHPSKMTTEELKTTISELRRMVPSTNKYFRVVRVYLWRRENPKKFKSLCQKLYRDLTNDLSKFIRVVNSSRQHSMSEKRQESKKKYRKYYRESGMRRKQMMSYYKKYCLAFSLYRILKKYVKADKKW